MGESPPWSVAITRVRVSRETEPRGYVWVDRKRLTLRGWGGSLWRLSAGWRPRGAGCVPAQTRSPRSWTLGVNSVRPGVTAKAQEPAPRMTENGR